MVRPEVVRFPSHRGCLTLVVRQPRRAFLIGYDRSVPRLRQANHCIGCGRCVEHCPQNIDIPAQMQRIDNFVEQLKQNPPV